MMSDESSGQGLVSEPPPPTRTCMTCGRSIDWRANVCPYCGHDFRAVAGPPPVAKTSKPVIGGVLVLIAGILIIGLYNEYIMKCTVEYSVCTFVVQAFTHDIQILRIGRVLMGLIIDGGFGRGIGFGV